MYRRFSKELIFTYYAERAPDGIPGAGSLWALGWRNLTPEPVGAAILSGICDPGLAIIPCRIDVKLLRQISLVELDRYLELE